MKLPALAALVQLGALKGPLLLSLCAVCAALGNSLQPISILTWLQLPVQLLAYEHLTQPHDCPAVSPSTHPLSLLAALSRGVSAAALLAVSQMLGAAFAFTTLFSDPAPTISSIAASAGIGGVLSIATTLLAVAPYLRLCPAQPTHRGAIHPAVHPLVLALLFAASQAALAGLLPDVAFMLPANAVLDFAPVVPLATLGGVAAINLALAFVAAAVHSHWRSSEGLAPPTASGNHSATESRESAACMERPEGMDGRPLTALAALAMVVLLFAAGGAAVFGGSFHAADVQALEAAQLPVSCVVAQYVLPGSGGWDRLWQHTAERVAAGDAIVMWAEEAVFVQSEEEESQLLAQAAALLRTHAVGQATAAAGSYLGISYLYANDVTTSGHGAGTDTNRFVLFGPSGAVVWTFLKAFPVPLIESDVRAGPGVLPVHDSPFGRLGGAICFDLDHAGFVLQAGRAGVDIMLQPSWTWGLVGPRHWAGNTLRAAENGFTLFRCSSDGVSGVVSPRGVILQQAVTAVEGLYLFALPQQHHIGTAFVAAGHLLQWVLLILAVPMWVWAAALPLLSGNSGAVTLPRWAGGAWAAVDGGRARSKDAEGGQEDETAPLCAVPLALRRSSSAFESEV